MLDNFNTHVSCVLNIIVKLKSQKRERREINLSKISSQFLQQKREILSHERKLGYV